MANACNVLTIPLQIQDPVGRQCAVTDKSFLKMELAKIAPTSKRPLQAVGSVLSLFAPKPQENEINYKN